MTERKMLPVEGGDDSDGDDEAIFLPKPTSSSGRWSALSWSSLYERASESSLSWADDELEKDATDKVRSIFNKIENEVYEESFRDQDPPNLPKDILDECKLWRDRFPHLRVVGHSIPRPEGTGVGHSDPQVQLEKVAEDIKHVKSAKDGLKNIPEKNPSHSNSLMSASSLVSSISVITLDEDEEDEDDEEVFAVDGAFLAKDLNLETSLQHGTIDVDIMLSDKFESDPKKYLEDKLMEGLFKKLWSAVSDDIQQLVDKFSLHLIEQNMNNQEDNFWSFDSTTMAVHSRLSGTTPLGFDFMDEDSILSSFGVPKTPLATRAPLASPVSDLNPISLPTLRPVPSSAPLFRNVPSRSPRPFKSIQERLKIGNSFRPMTVVSNQGLILPNNSEKRFLKNFSIEEETVIRNQGVKPRSKSGSPPVRPPSSSRPHPISLPPIQHNGRTPSAGFSSMTLPRIGSSALSTPRSLRVDGGKATPVSRPPTSEISVSGIRLKKLQGDRMPDHAKGGRLTSDNATPNWDAKNNLTPSVIARPRFRI